VIAFTGFMSTLTSLVGVGATATMRTIDEPSSALVVVVVVSRRDQVIEVNAA